MSTFNVLKAVSVRLCLLLHSLLTTWRVTVNWSNDQFWLLVVANVPFIVEGLYTVIRRKGIEWKWMCPCFFFYLLSTIPGIWLLEINSLNAYGNINSTAVQDITISGINIPIRLSADTWNLVVEESLLYLMILGRWFLPRGDVSREQLSELLFAFLGIASDIMELFALFDENPVRSSTVMTYALLAVWSWSILQFVLVITVSHRPKRRRIQRIPGAGEDVTNVVVFEIIGIFVSLFMQDVPFLVLRMYTMITFDLLNYSLIFFTAKNVLVILLLWYRLVIMCSNHFCGKKRRMRKAAAAAARKNLPLGAVVCGSDNYKRFEDAIEETMYDKDYEIFVNEDEMVRKRKRDSSKSESIIVDSDINPPSEQVQSNHKEVSSVSDRDESLKSDEKPESTTKLPQNERGNPPLVPQDSGRHSVSSESMAGEDSPKSRNGRVPAGSDLVSESEDVNTSSTFTPGVPSEKVKRQDSPKSRNGRVPAESDLVAEKDVNTSSTFTPEVPSENVADDKSKKHISIINVRL
ncbi:transmembrane protein 26-like [Gigantopelta aegis]|uniref:transmembrane protein 26-like n=1 Tax=Gigantopelta aegis TaxID=1735272 RepID=UPI001B88CABD|nr:transmembrane protein 26-like [Gigantopelta aegis]